MASLKSWSMLFMRTNRAAGFTLVEVMVIAPIIILFIGAFVGLIVSLTGDSLQMRSSNEASYQVQNALDVIEADAARSSDTYPSTTGALTSPQGSNNGTTAFTVANNDSSATDTDVLIIKTPATTLDAVNPNRELIRYNTPNACSATNVNENAYYPVTTVYFVASGTLWQRTILPSSGTPCSTPWQKGSCAESQPIAGVCKTYDSKLAENVSTFSVKYLSAAGAAVSSSSPSSAKAIEISIKVDKTVAGKTVSYSSKIRSTLPSLGGSVPILAGKSKKFSFNSQYNSSGYYHGNACAVASGALYCWGDGGSYELGNGTQTGLTTPTLVGGALAGKTVTAVYTTRFGDVNVNGSMTATTCAIADGSLYCWGRNYMNYYGGALTGNGTSTANVTTPTLVGGALAGKTVGQ